MKQFITEQLRKKRSLESKQSFRQQSCKIGGNAFACLLTRRHGHTCTKHSVLMSCKPPCMLLLTQLTLFDGVSDSQPVSVLSCFTSCTTSVHVFTWDTTCAIRPQVTSKFVCSVDSHYYSAVYAHAASSAAWLQCQSVLAQASLTLHQFVLHIL